MDTNRRAVPEIGKPIILTVKYEDGSKSVEVGDVDASRGLHEQNGKEVTEQVVAWMPLPAPYEP
ncbi:hypothetical protein [Pontibacter mucosus]|uniref:hypothetical protein n=1 Tax=Pontibacter mucosus TaxID=1649266 RepID=UPI000D3B1095|nr:hypothetical protein [Pontibacter mucosus]